MLLQFFGENKRYRLFDIAYFFFHGDDTATTHASTIVCIVYLPSTSTSQMFYAGTECIRLLQHRNEVPCVYATIFTAQNYFTLRREASVRMQPAHNVFLIPTLYLNVYFQAHARSAKTWRLGASIQAFFRFFLLKNVLFCCFLTIFALF